MAAKASGDGGQADGSDGQEAAGAAQPGAGTATLPEAPAGGTGVPGAPVAGDPKAGQADPKAVPGAQDPAPAAAPLTPPAPKKVTPAPAVKVTEPNAAVRDAPSDGNGTAIVGHDGEPLDPESMFTESAPHHTFLEVAHDIFEKFHFPGQQRDTGQSSMQLVARKGTQIPRDKAHEIVQAARGVSADDAGESAGTAK